tara:strand:- start:885 stop:1082 length:198 start_codon:yes stop_codon:yes gene_type:complete
LTYLAVVNHVKRAGALEDHFHELLNGVLDSGAGASSGPPPAAETRSLAVRSEGVIVKGLGSSAEL